MLNAAPQTRCGLCTDGPSGPQGHEDMSPRLGQLARLSRHRVILLFTCRACHVRWARKRVGTAQFRWLPLA
jgi:hypothetical protein